MCVFLPACLSPVTPPLCSRGRLQEELCCSGVTIRNQDFIAALQTLQDAQSTAIGAPKVRRKGVGGGEGGFGQGLKRQILTTPTLCLCVGV